VDLPNKELTGFFGVP